MSRDAELRALADAVELDIAMNKLSAPQVFTRMRDIMNLALLTRTEAAQVDYHCGGCGNRWVGDGSDQTCPACNPSEAAQVGGGAVAWMREGATSVLHNFRFDRPDKGPWLPLYTHPQDASAVAEVCVHAGQKYIKWTDGDYHYMPVGTRFYAAMSAKGEG